MRHFKEAILCDFMCNVYNYYYTVSLLCSRRDSINSNKLAEGTVLTSKDWRKKVKEQDRAAVQSRVQSSK